jgi:menaquinol-cytochrome c reductase iron-sulfur subunit
MISPAQSAPAGKPECSTGAEERRGFLFKALAMLLGAVAYLPPMLIGVVSFLNPLRQKAQAGQFMRLATLDALPADGPPLKTTVTMDRVDAWNRSANQPVGAVFLSRIGPNEVRAIHVVCPHAGCFVSYDPGKKSFLCPCHNASFDLEGKRLDAVSNSPRDLDTLECKIEGSEVWVRFQNFRTGTSDKIADA